MERNVLIIDNYGCRYGQKKILLNIDILVNETGIYQLLGPCGAGKTTLLRSFANKNKLCSIFSESGNIFYKGKILTDKDCPAFLEQKPAQMLGTVFSNIIQLLPEKSKLSIKQQQNLVIRSMQQYMVGFLIADLNTTLTNLSLVDRRLVSILSLIITSPAVVLLDEPTKNLSDTDAHKLLNVVIQISKTRAVFIIQHNQQFAKSIGGSVLLLAGGTIQEQTESNLFFTNPKSEAGKEFIKSGTCSAPSPSTDKKYISDEYINKYVPVKPIIKKNKLIPFGTIGFKWVLRDRLGVTPRPGLIADLEYDLEALSKIKIDYLICLEISTINLMLAEKHNIKVAHFPFEDMTAPTLELIQIIVKTIDDLLNKGRIVAIHCRAGLGRTGTVLASYYIYLGYTPQEAIKRTRLLDVRMIQSEDQENFVMSLDKKILI